MRRGLISLSLIALVISLFLVFARKDSVPPAVAFGHKFAVATFQLGDFASGYVMLSEKGQKALSVAQFSESMDSTRRTYGVPKVVVPTGYHELPEHRRVVTYYSMQGAERESWYLQLTIMSEESGKYKVAGYRFSKTEFPRLGG